MEGEVGSAMSGSEDMIEILIGERDRALKENFQLKRERDEARAEVEHLRAGIEAYRRAFEEFDAEYSPSDFLSPETLEAMRKWEREDTQRDEKG